MTTKVFSTTKSILIIAALACLPVLRAHEGHKAAPATSDFFSQSAKLGDGQVQTYMVLSKERDANRQRIPVSIGVEISEASMNSLPDDLTTIMLDFPIQARATPFQFLMLNWNPSGHPPAGVYTLPHFDLHFFIQDMEEVMNIKPGNCQGLDCAAFALATKPVPQRFQPANYLDVAEVVPFMGNHLIDAQAPELSGAKFTQTFIYGAFDGQISFYEPMITREFMRSGKAANQCTAFRIPQQYEQPGYYPSKYCTVYDKEHKSYRVYLTGFTYRAAGLIYRTEE